MYFFRVGLRAARSASLAALRIAPHGLKTPPGGIQLSRSNNSEVGTGIKKAAHDFARQSAGAECRMPSAWLRFRGPAKLALWAQTMRGPDP